MWNDRQLEDELGDVVAKSRYGQDVSVASVAQALDWSEDDVVALEAYKKTVTEAEVRKLASVLNLQAEALWAVARDAHTPSIPRFPENVQVVPFQFAPIGSRGYLVHITGASAAPAHTVMVDPGGDVGPVVETLNERGWTLDGILVTHGHTDHVAGVPDLVRETGAPVYAHPEEWAGEGAVAVEGADGGETTMTVAGLSVKVIACPGHTPHGLTFVVADVAFVGDTLFAGSLGRAYEGPRYYTTLIASARRLLQLPASTILLPGHGPATTVREEARANPFIAFST